MPSFSWMIFFRHRYIWSLRIPVLCGGRTWLNYCPAAIVHIKRLKSRTLKTSVVSSIATTHITILRASTRYHCRSLSLSLKRRDLRCLPISSPSGNKRTIHTIHSLKTTKTKTEYLSLQAVPLLCMCW